MVPGQQPPGVPQYQHQSQSQPPAGMPQYQSQYYIEQLQQPVVQYHPHQLPQYNQQQRIVAIHHEQPYLQQQQQLHSCYYPSYVDQVPMIAAPPHAITLSQSAVVDCTEGVDGDGIARRVAAIVQYNIAIGIGACQLVAEIGTDVGIEVRPVAVVQVPLVVVRAWRSPSISSRLISTSSEWEQ